MVIPKHIVDRYAQKVMEQIENEILTGMKNPSPEMMQIHCLTEKLREQVEEMEFSQCLGRTSYQF